MYKKLLSGILFATIVSLTGLTSASASYTGLTLFPQNNKFTIDVASSGNATLSGFSQILGSIVLAFGTAFDGELTVLVGNTRPASAGSDPDGVVYGYWEIDGSEINNALNTATFNFTVTKAWLNQNNIAKDQVTLRHHTSGNWQSVSTQIVSETDTSVSYTASTGSFSAFAVTGAANTAATATAATGENLFILVGVIGALLMVGGWSLWQAKRNPAA